jgi:outer membrane protein
MMLMALVALLALTMGCEQQGGSTAATGTETAGGTTATPSIVYVRSDSILANYKSFSDKLAALETKMMEEEEKLQRRGRALEQEAAALQRKIQQGLLAPNQVNAEQGRLAGRQQEIMQQRDEALQQLQQQQLEMNTELQDNVQRVLKELQDERGYDIILSYGPGTGVLLARDGLDITEEVLRRLNAGPGAPPATDAATTD